jgi:hypothetical protein
MMKVPGKIRMPGLLFQPFREFVANRRSEKPIQFEALIRYC